MFRWTAPESASTATDASLLPQRAGVNELLRVVQLAQFTMEMGSQEASPWWRRALPSCLCFGVQHASNTLFCVVTSCSPAAPSSQLLPVDTVMLCARSNLRASQAFESRANRGWLYYYSMYVSVAAPPS